MFVCYNKFSRAINIHPITRVAKMAWLKWQELITGEDLLFAIYRQYALAPYLVIRIITILINDVMFLR